MHQSTRILYQSFTDPDRHQPYLERLTKYLDSISSENVTFEVRGMQPADTQLGRLSELRCGIQSLAGIIDAEKEGFDAVLIGHFQDSLLFEAKTSVDIPVIGHGEASLFQACQLGGRIGIVSIDPVYIPWHREQVQRYGLSERVVAVRSMQISPDLAVAAFDDPEAYGAIRTNFIELAEAMVYESGVDVVLSAGGLFALLSAHDDSLTLDGAIIVNPTLLAVKQAEIAVSLARTTGVSVSRGSTYARASTQAVDEFMSILRTTSQMNPLHNPEPAKEEKKMHYTAEARADGNGRNGKVLSSDGIVDLQLGIPTELGGAGGEVSNPEQLFAAGYAGCFMSALATVAREHRVKLTDPSVTAQVTISGGTRGFDLSVVLIADLPGVDPDSARTILDGAHAKCPYSRAVSGNIAVEIVQK